MRLCWSQGTGLGSSAPGNTGCSWRCECAASHLQKGSLGLSSSKIIPGHRMDYYTGVLKEFFLEQKIKFAGWLVAESHRQSATVCSVPNVLLIRSWAAKLLSVNNLLFVAVVELPACLWYYGLLTIPFPRGAAAHPHLDPPIAAKLQDFRVTHLLLCKSISGCVEPLHESGSWLLLEIPEIYNIGIQSHMLL